MGFAAASQINSQSLGYNNYQSIAPPDRLNRMTRAVGTLIRVRAVCAYDK